MIITPISIFPRHRGKRFKTPVLTRRKHGTQRGGAATKVGVTREKNRKGRQGKTNLYLAILASMAR